MTPRHDAERRLLVVPLGGPHDVLSWALVGGGARRAEAVVWRQVDHGELESGLDAALLLEQALAQAGWPDGVGLLTGARLRHFVTAEVAATELGGDEGWARAVVTCGLDNALRTGDPPGPLERVGTINVLAQLSMPLAPEALVEAVALVAEARTAVLVERHVPSRRTGRPASGTGTDCIVIAAPARPGGARWCGKHTIAGALLGAAVERATARAVERWLSGARD